MPVSAKHVLQQGPVLAAIGRTALAALEQRWGKPSGQAGPPATPGPWVNVDLAPRPDDLIDDYIRACGGDRSAYRKVVPAHLFPQWGFPLQARSTKQGSTAHCTPEAEIVALDEAVRTLGIPAFDFWDVVRPPSSAAGPVLAQCMEDITATIAIVTSGNNPALRHVARTQKVDVGFLHEVFTGQVFLPR